MATVMKIYCLICSIALISCFNSSTKDSDLDADEYVHHPASMQQAEALSNDSLLFPTDDLTKIYVYSITAYIKAMRKDYDIKFDTLYFGKHRNEQPEGFPDIDLPATIENTQIRLVNPESKAVKQMDNKSSFYINLISWVNQEEAEFIFVAFNSRFEHLFDYSVSYNYNTVDKQFHLAQAKFERFTK